MEKAKRDEEEGTMERDTHFLRQPSLIKGNCQHMSDYKNDFNFRDTVINVNVILIY
jgi:hypothetical protein